MIYDASSMFSNRIDQKQSDGFAMPAIKFDHPLGDDFLLARWIGAQHPGERLSKSAEEVPIADAEAIKREFYRLDRHYSYWAIFPRPVEEIRIVPLIFVEHASASSNRRDPA